MTLKNDDQASNDTSSSSTKAGPATQIYIGGFHNPPLEAGSTCNIGVISTVLDQDGTLINDGKVFWSLITSPPTTYLSITDSGNGRSADIKGIVEEDTYVTLTATYSADLTLSTQERFLLKTFTVTNPDPDPGVTIKAYTPTWDSKFKEGDLFDFSVNNTGISDDSSDYTVDYVIHYQGQNIVIVTSSEPPQFRAKAIAVRHGPYDSPWAILTKKSFPEEIISMGYFRYEVEYAAITIAPSSPPHNKSYKAGEFIELAIDTTGIFNVTAPFYSVEYYNEAGGLIGTSTEAFANFFLPYTIPEDSPSRASIEASLIDSRWSHKVFKTTINFTVTQ